MRPSCWPSCGLAGESERSPAARSSRWAGPASAAGSWKYQYRAGIYINARGNPWPGASGVRPLRMRFRAAPAPRELVFECGQYVY